MPKWKESSPELVARFEAALPRDPRITPRKMFGYPASFLSEGFFAGLFEERVVVRLPADVHAKTKALAKAASFDPMGGRPMKGWYVVPDAVAADGKKLGALLAELLPQLANHPEQPSAKKRAPGAAPAVKPKPSRAKKAPAAKRR